MRALAFACTLLLAFASQALAQLDPLLFMKNAAPNVLIVVDTSARMQRDTNGDYYDQYIYPRTGALWEASLGVPPYAFRYRRKYVGLINLDNSVSSDKFETQRIAVVGDSDPGSFALFDARTFMGIARASLSRAVQLNRSAVRFGLIKMRQLDPTFGTYLNEGPVRNDDPFQQSPTDRSSQGKWSITTPTVGAPNGSLLSVTAPVVRPDSATANSDILTLLGRSPVQGGLLPAGRDGANVLDAPVKYMLDDARAEAVRLIGSDTMGRNTVVVLVVAGGEGNTSSQDPAGAASTFRNIQGASCSGVTGRRVPIYVVAIAPPSSDVAQLQAIARNSGGQYVEITPAMVDAVPAGSPVPEFVRAVNTAVQHAFASVADFNTLPTAQLPYGPSTEYQVTSPIIGSVDLSNARDIDGVALENSVITTDAGTVIPQRSNLLVTTGVAVPAGADTPGFPGRLRAFRAYRPVQDNTKTAGYKFVGDGTALWVARTPTAAEGSRNIYTVLPDGTMTSFTVDNASTLQPYLRDSDAADLIDYIRNLPLGAFLDSTPAILDAPSLDPPPDADYPAFVDANKNRRTLIFIGGNDGMLHAIDGRTGVEVWAFIPFNLLPRLRALREGQAVGNFTFFVDGSPKIADVKVGGQWRSYLIFGEGPGGTFYQAMDVTLPDMAAQVSTSSDNVSTILGYFSAAGHVPFKWSYPSYSSFDYTISTDVTPYGDLRADATTLEKSVGQTWSDPAVGQVQNPSGTYVVLTGSGFLPRSQENQYNRGGTPAGTTFYVLDVRTGSVLDSRDVGNDGYAEYVDNCAAAGSCVRMKNALQSDPVATGPPNSRFIEVAYAGDLDGRLWRFALGLDDDHNATITAGPTQLFDAGASHPLFSSMAVVNVGGTQQYIFFGSGSDLLPSTGVSQSYKLFGVLDNNGTGMSKFQVTLQPTDEVHGGEKVSAFPAVAGDIVFFSTTTFKGVPSCSAADTNLYALTFIGGPAYDNTGDDAVTKKDTPKVKTIAGGGRATAPFVVDQHLFIGSGNNVALFGDPQDFNNGVGQVGVRILSWREIR